MKRILPLAMLALSLAACARSHDAQTDTTAISQPAPVPALSADSVAKLDTAQRHADSVANSVAADSTRAKSRSLKHAKKHASLMSLFVGTAYAQSTARTVTTEPAHSHTRSIVIGIVVILLLLAGWAWYRKRTPPNTSV